VGGVVERKVRKGGRSGGGGKGELRARWGQREKRKEGGWRGEERGVGSGEIWGVGQTGEGRCRGRYE